MRGLGDKIPMRLDTHYAMCMFMERATGIEAIDNAQVHMLQVPRGTGKSGLGTAGLCILRLLQNEGYAIGLANETQLMASEFLGQVRAEFEENEILRVLWPERIPDITKTTWTQTEITIKRNRARPNPSIRAIGVGGTLTGVHTDHWILDDLISQNAADSAIKGTFTAIDDANRWIVRLPPLLSYPERDPIDVICTPWYEGDTYHFLERMFGRVPQGMDLADHEPDFKCLWQLTLPDGTKQTIPLYRRGRLAVFRRPAIENGRSIFPEKYSVDYIQELRTDPETAPFVEAQYMLNPSGGHASTFSLQDLKYFEWDGEYMIRFVDQLGNWKYVMVRDLTCYIAIDPAFSDKSTAARTAIPVVATDGKHIFLLEDFAEHGMSTDDIVSKVVDFALKYRPHRIFLETIVAQRALAHPIRRGLLDAGLGSVIFEEIPKHSEENKKLRIFGLEPYFKKGIFYLHKSHNNFVREYTVFPRGVLRDVLDGISFMRDELERIFTVAARRDRTGHQDAHAEAIARIKKAVR